MVGDGWDYQLADRELNQKKRAIARKHGRCPDPFFSDIDDDELKRGYGQHHSDGYDAWEREMKRRGFTV